MVFAHTKQQDNHYKPKMIKLKCSNPKCNYSYEITSDELKEDGELHQFCFICGGKIEVMNLSEIIDKDLEIQIKENIDKWLKKLGGDETLSLLQRNKNAPGYRQYREELIKRGFRIK